ncbi:MAG: protein kinase [Labilithrix sp.]|nr:protein kinase [Labilithrix sp.]MCW5818042.1 protein kinase [Labilithrix sp.]
MGQVFAATDLDARTHVALKVVSRLFVDETLMLRLHREAVAAQRIRSDYVPQVYEVGDTGDGETFLVMERLMGEPLSARIRAVGALQWNEVARIGEEILRGLIDAHAAGIIHRDLKPSNVFLALKTGRVRAMVLDFGVCKMDGLDTERLTGTGESIGTVAYMAPEQIRGAAKVDERADVYAFGVLVYEMLSGRLPHEGPSQMAILASKLEKEPAPLRSYCRFPVPEALDALLQRCLARGPHERPSSATELLREWRAIARSEGFLTGPSIPPPPRMPSGPPPPPSARDDEDPPTEISKPDALPGGLAMRLGSSSDDELLPATRTPVDFAEILPPEKYPTEVPLIKGPESQPSVPSSAHAPGQGAKLAGMVAIAAVLVGVCVLAFAFSRPDPPTRARSVATAPPPVVDTSEPEPVPPAPTEEVISADDSLELPADPAPVSGAGASRPRPPMSSPRPRPAASPAPKPKGNQGITSQPRY